MESVSTYWDCASGRWAAKCHFQWVTREGPLQPSRHRGFWDQKTGLWHWSACGFSATGLPKLSDDLGEGVLALLQSPGTSAMPQADVPSEEEATCYHGTLMPKDRHAQEDARVAVRSPGDSVKHRAGVDNAARQAGQSTVIDVPSAVVSATDFGKLCRDLGELDVDPSKMHRKRRLAKDAITSADLSRRRQGLATVNGRAMPPEDDVLSHGVCVGSRPMDEVVPTSSAHVHLKTAKMGDDVPLGVMSPHHASKGTDCAKIARGQKQVSDSLGGSFEVVSELAHGHDNALLKARRMWKCLEVRIQLKVPLACSVEACHVHCGAESP